jgi:hypothetical protein
MQALINPWLIGTTAAAGAGYYFYWKKKQSPYAPLNNIHIHVCAFHCYCGEVKRQVRAHHFCSHLNKDFRQCVIYDSDKPDAKLIGIEYIISEKLFKTLSDEEKKLWHSHRHEVKSGQLIAVGIPEVVEHQIMKELVGTYGKTFHTWQVDRDELPLGVPQLMMSFNQDGQVNEELLKKRDQEYNVSTEEKRKKRQDIEAPEEDPMADYWLKKKLSYQTTLTSKKPMKSQ